MTEEVKLSDNPGVETQIYMLGRAINSLIREVRDTKEHVGSNTDAMHEWGALQAKQNGNVAEMKKDLNEITDRLDIHDKWHGEEDQKIIARAHKEEIVEARHQSVKDLLKFQWKLGGGLIGAGLAIGKVVHELGWW